MECSICNRSILAPGSFSTNSDRFGEKSEDGTWRCNACIEIADMFTSISTKRNEPEQKKEEPKKISASSVSCYCKKCNKKTYIVDKACEICKTISPLYIRNKGK